MIDSDGSPSHLPSVLLNVPALFPNSLAPFLMVLFNKPSGISVCIWRKKRMLPLCKTQYAKQSQQQALSKRRQQWQEVLKRSITFSTNDQNQKFFKYTGVKQGCFSPELLPRCYISVFQEHRVVFEKIQFKILYFSKHSMVIKPWFDKSHGMMLKT